MQIILNENETKKDTTKQEQKDRSLRDEQLSIIRGLASEFTGLYYVNLDTDEYTPYLIAKKIENIKPFLEQNPKFTSLLREFFDSDLVHPDDRKDLHTFYPSVEAVRRALDGKKKISTTFRRNYSGEFLWTELDIIKTEGTAEEAHNVIVGFAEKDKDIKEHLKRLQREREEQERKDRLISTMSGNDALFLIDCAKDTRATVQDHCNGADFYTDNDSYTYSISKYINTFVVPPDRDMMREMTSISYMMERTKKEQEYAVEYRDTTTGVPRFYKMRVVRLSDTEVLQSFIADDKALVDEQLLSKLKEDYIAIYGLDLDTGLMQPLKNLPWYSIGEEGTVFPYAPAMQKFASLFDGAEKEFFETISSVDELRERYAGRDRGSFVFEMNSPDGDLWINISGLVTMRHEDGTPFLFIMGFSLLDEDASARKELEKVTEAALFRANNEMRHNDFLYEVLNGGRWSYEFNAADEVTAAHYSDKTMKITDIEYSGKPMGWVERVHPEDRDRVVKEFMAAIMDHSGKTIYDSTFRMVQKGGSYRWTKSTGRALRQPDGSGELLGISIDITEQLEEEQKRLFEKNEIERLRMKELELLHSEFRASALGYLAEHEGDIASYLDFFASRLRELIKCDQVIYMNTAGETYINNSPRLGKDFEIPHEYCLSCDHYDPFAPIYASGVAEMSDKRTGVDGVLSHKDCPVKSALTRLVYLDGKVNGYLAIHYILDYHRFTDYERQTLEEFANLLSLSLSRHAAKVRNAENDARLFALEDTFLSLYDVELESGYYTSFERDDFYKRNISDNVVSMTEFFKDLRTNVDRVVYEEDREATFAVQQKENIIKALASKDHIDHYYRVITESGPMWLKMRIVYKNAERKNIVIGIFNAEEEMAARQKEEAFKEELAQTNARLFALEDNFESLYDVEMESGHYELFVKGDFFKNSVLDKLSVPKDYFEELRTNIDAVIYEEDREGLFNKLTRESIRKELSENERFDYLYRVNSEKGPVWLKIRIVYKDAEKKNIIIGVFNAEKDVEAQQLQEALDIANEANASNKLVLSFVNGIKWSYFINNDDDIFAVKYGESAVETYDVANAGEPMEWVKLLHPDDREYVYTSFMEAVRDRSGKTPINMTYRLKGVDGKYHWTKNSGKVSFHEDGVRELFGISIDVTEQIEKEREQQLQLEEALSMAQSANRAKTIFLNNMSHDIRTPMNAIIGYTGLAASHINNKEQVQDYLSKIAQSSDHLLSLINDVLDMSRIESGKMNIDEKPENLSDIIHTLRDIVQADIHSKQLDFFVDAVDVNDEDVICDKLRLNQVLLNILSNAIKYTAAGGTVTMRVTEKTVKQTGYASYEFKVKDNGMGMDEEFLATIFDPFTRVKSSTVSGIQGTGLGMAITKNIIDMMGGRIDIASEPGKGTEVTVVFDLKLQSAPKAPAEIPELKGVRALVADDDSNTCLSICNMVKDIGMRFEWCTSGKEAVIRAEAAYRGGDSFRVYIIDWIMPDMNGIETTRRIRKVIGDDVPIIILTAYDWSDIEEEAREAGVTAFVSKPMFPSDLHRVLNNCIGRGEEKAEVPVAEYDFDGKKILLVEDNELNREIAVALLEESGFKVSCAEDGDIAVEKMKAAKAGDYDLVLMDIQMPRMDGYEATRQIRALGTEISGIPILAMTANAFEEDRKAALEAGMNEHIAKPIDVEKLKETLARFL